MRNATDFRPFGGNMPRPFDSRPDTSPDLVVVVPCRDEEGNLRTLVEEVDGCGLGDVRLVLVDDGSSDGTWAEMGRLCASRGRMTCLRLAPCGAGKERAMRRGLACALDMRPTLVAVMDADMQDPPGLLPGMCRDVLSGACSQSVAVRDGRKGESVAYRAGAGLYHVLMAGAVGDGWSGVRDMRVMRPEVVRAFLAGPVGSSCLKFDTIRVYGDAGRVRYEWAPRAHGKSSWKPMRLARFACEGIVTSSSWLEFLPVAMGVLALVAGVAMLVAGVVCGLDGVAVAGCACLVSVPLHVGVSVCALMLHSVMASVREVEADVVEVVSA